MNNKDLFKTIKNDLDNSNLKKLSKIDECILDPSMMPFLSELKKTKLRKIWIPDEFLEIENKEKLSKLIRP